MNASMVPFEVASKQSSGGMIWPPGKTSIRNRPPLISSTIFASCWAGTKPRSIDLGQAVDIRHWTFGCAMTWGASTSAIAASVAIAPLVFARNLRRSFITLPSSPRHELMVGAFGDAIPGTHQRLELRERRVDFPGHGRLLGFFPDHLGRQLPEIAQHRHREREHLDFALELRLEPFERDGVLRVEGREAIDLHRCGGVVERPPQIHRKRLVRLLVETELVCGTWLVPARVVVVTRGLVQAQLHVVVRSNPFAGVDHAPLERGIDIGGRNEDYRGARPGIDLSAEGANTYLEALVVSDRGDLLPEPSGHLRRLRPDRAGHEVEGGVRLLHQLEPVTLVEPGRHALGVHAERNRVEPLDRGLLLRPVERSGHEGLDGAFRSRVEALERLHDLAAREDLDPESPAAHLLDDLRQLLGGALHVEIAGPGRGHAPLDLRLS